MVDQTPRPRGSGPWLGQVKPRMVATTSMQTLIPQLEDFRLRLTLSRPFATHLQCLAVMARFPNGCCKPASLLAARYIVASLAVPHTRVQLHANGVRGRTSHAWLRVEDNIVDITIDQFSDGPRSLVVPLSSSWHAEFTGDRPYLYADFMQMSQHYRNDFDALYEHALSRDTTIQPAPVALQPLPAQPVADTVE